MPKFVTVTAAITFSAEVPKAWKEDDLQANVEDALRISVESTNKKVVVGDVEIEWDIEEDEE